MSTGVNVQINVPVYYSNVYGWQYSQDLVAHYFYADNNPGWTNLNDGAVCWLKSDTDLAFAPIRRLEERGPLQHGVTDLGYRLDARMFTLTFKMFGSSLADLYTRRAAFLALFKPSVAAAPIQLRFPLPNGVIRQIDVFVSGVIKMDTTDREGFSQTIVVSLKAPNPVFYDPAQNTVIYGGPGMLVPLAVPVNTTTPYTQLPLAYPGTFAESPIITLYGPLTSPIITNNTTGEKLDFTGTTITGGHYYVIDTRYGYKTVLDDTATSRIYALTSDSNLATFHLDPFTSDGVNYFNFTNAGSSQIKVSWFNRFIGI